MCFSYVGILRDCGVGLLGSNVVIVPWLLLIVLGGGILASEIGMIIDLGAYF